MVLDASKDVHAVRELLEMFHAWLKDHAPLPSADCIWQIGDMKKMLREWKLYYDTYRHLRHSKKDQELKELREEQELEDSKRLLKLLCHTLQQKLDDSKKDQELKAAKKLEDSKRLLKFHTLPQELDVSKNVCDLVDLRKDQELEDSKNDQELEDSTRLLKNDCDLDDLMEDGMMFNPVKKSLLKNIFLPKRIECTDSNLLREFQALLDFTENGWRECQRTELTHEARLALVDHFSLSRQYEPYIEGVFSAEMQKLMEELCSLPERVNHSTISTSWMHAFEDSVAEMQNASVIDGIAENDEETEAEGQALGTVHGEEANYNQQSLKMEQPYYYAIIETLKKPSLEKSEKAILEKANIDKLLLDVVSDTNPSECHNPSDSYSNVAQNEVVNRAESGPVETQRDRLSEDEESQKFDATLDVEDCTMEELTELSGDSESSVMNDYLEGPTVEALADDESGSVHTEHSGCNTETTAYAPVPAEGVQPMLMHSSVDEEPQKATSASVTAESPDMKVVSALTQDQATDVTIAQMASLKAAQGIVHPQAAQVVVVCQATALLTVHKLTQFTQTLTLPTSQVTVQTVYEPPQSGVMVTAAQMWEAPQARALPVAQVCTFEAAPKTAPAAVQVGCTFETDLVLVPQAPQECALDVDQGTSVQTGQVSVFSSHVAGCKAGDGVVQISKTASQSYAETSQYTKTYTALPPTDELSHSAASQSGIDELGHSTASQSGIDHLGHSTASRSGIDEFGHSTASQSGIDDVQKCEVDVQPSPHVSDNQSSSEGVHVPQQEEAGNDGAAGDDSVAPYPSTAIPSVMVVNSLSSSVSINARNMVGLPTCTLYTGKTEQQHKNVPAKEDSEERKKKAMDRLRKEREERVKQNTDAVKKTSDAYSGSSKASGGVGDSDVRTPTHQTLHAVTKGLVLLSNVPHIFQEGAYVPLPSQEAMAKTIGKGGNGVVAYIYHGGREFAVKETGLRQEELETWSVVNHRNVIKVCAVVEGDWDSACPGARRCFQMMPRVTGDIKSLLEERERPTLCHYFFDFKEDSESAGLVLGNAKYILLGVLNGLKHLHSLGIMHRDIKLQNILVNRHCQCRDIFLCPHDGDSGYGVLISDFDSALQVERGREKLERTKLHGRPIKYSVHGTAGYRPPETSFSMTCNEVLPEWVSLKTDIWSFGTMLVKFFVGSRGPHSQREMATLLLSDCLQSPTAAQRPTGVKIDRLRQALAVGPDEMKTLQKIALLEKYFPLATDLHRLVQFCLTVNVEERPTVEQVMEKAFFRPLKQDSH